MTVVEKICRACEVGSFLHDDYSYISHVEVDLAIEVKSAHGRRRENGGARCQWKHLIIVAESCRVWEEQVVRELVLQIRVERVSRGRSGGSSCARK